MPTILLHLGNTLTQLNKLPMADPPPSTPKKKRLTRDQRRDILLMRSLGKKYSEIALHLNVSERAVQYTCNTQMATPKKRSGRPPKLSEERVDEIENYISKQSRDARRMTYQELATTFDTSVDCIKRALRKRRRKSSGAALTS